MSSQLKQALGRVRDLLQRQPWLSDSQTRGAGAVVLSPLRRGTSNRRTVVSAGSC
jgi:hypothetical protein